MTEAYLTACQVRQRFGNITDMTLWRWIKHAELGFPQPIVIRRRRFFRLADVEAFEARAAAGKVAA